VSYEALIAAQAKRLTKKRERKMDRTYADLYVPPAPERVEVRRTPVYEHEMSHKEWADGYKQWRDAHKTPSYIGVFGLDPEWHERAEQGKAYRRLRCFAENEI
jgi:hypothetical protein